MSMSVFNSPTIGEFINSIGEVFLIKRHPDSSRYVDVYTKLGVRAGMYDIPYLSSLKGCTLKLYSNNKKSHMPKWF